MAGINVRTDDETEAAIAELMTDGRDRSTAIRDAIICAARIHRERRIRAEAEAVASDPDDRAEMRQVLADMEDLRAW